MHLLPGKLRSPALGPLGPLGRSVCSAC